MSTPLENYLASTKGQLPNAAMIAYVANLQQVAATGPEIAASIGVGTIVTAFFMGPLIEYFNEKIARPMLGETT